MSRPPDKLEEHLRERFRLAQFREGQREVVETVLDGRSALVVMPTGGGKSLCYQLPALLLPGVTLVVSPLIALMKDQVDALAELGLPATLINSTLSLDAQRRRLSRVVAGAVKLLFVAPERFRNERFRQALERVEVSLLAVDEAHCISQWGHDFRPDYLELGEVRRGLGEPVTLALTATATPRVRDDIRQQLGIPDAKTFVSGFERENLFLEVYQASGNRDKLTRLRALVASVDGPVLVYCMTRKVVEEVAMRLQADGLRAGFYHAGLSDDERDTVQDDFMDGALDILVATNAFGMGVDKPDIRAIVHYQIPASLEAYYQEAGRAGRDGLPAHCLLLYNYADRRIPDFFIDNNYPERPVVEKVWKTVRRLSNGAEPIDEWLLSANLPRKVTDFAAASALKLLERARHVDLETRGPQMRITALDQALAHQLRVDWDIVDERRAYERERLKRVIFYATGARCRTADILRYFGSRSSERRGCGHCDNCIGVPSYADAPVSSLSSQRLVGGEGERRGDRIRAPEPLVTVVRKIAACVARCRQRESMRTIAQVLVGSRAQSIKRRDLHRLSTYGILKGMRRSDAERLIANLVGAGLLAERGGRIGLTPPAVSVMKGEAPLPPAVEAALGRLVETSPVRSVGEGSDVAPTVVETLRLLSDGGDVYEVARSRGLTVETILRHLIDGARAGAAADVDLTRYLDGALLPVIRTVAEELDWEPSLKRFREAVHQVHPGSRPSYDKLKLHIAYLIQQGEVS